MTDKAYAYLVKVAANANNNKYYEMEDNGDGTFTSSYGRVGRNPQRKTYPITQWDKIYRQKLNPRKGYTDITHTRAVQSDNSNDTGDKIVTDSQVVRDIFRFLLSSTSQSVSRSYLVPVQGVTQAMIDDAQGIIDSLVTLRKAEDWSVFNSELQRLFTIIPRKMDNVADFLLVDKNKDEAARIISSEEDTLDSLKGQVVVAATDDKDEQRDSLFDKLGIAVYDVDASDRRMLIDELTDIKQRYHQAVRIENNRTMKRYSEWINKQRNKQQMQLWHGSRTQNWISLLQKGLLIRPSGAIYSGSMFGDGLYFAPRAKKSLGYTSLSGSYWARGSDRRGYMALFDVHVGRMKKYRRHSSECYYLNYDKIRNQGYDSTMGEKGYSLANDEIIVYNINQTNIRYLVELR